MDGLTKEDAARLLSDVNPNDYFYLSNGTAVKNLRELSKAIKIISDDEFNGHVSADNNDFLNWVNACVTDENLAWSMKGITSRRNIENLISKRVDVLKELREEDDFVEIPEGSEVVDLEEQPEVQEELEQEEKPKQPEEHKKDYAELDKESTEEMIDEIEDKDIVGILKKLKEEVEETKATSLGRKKGKIHAIKRNIKNNLFNKLTQKMYSNAGVKEENVEEAAKEKEEEEEPEEKPEKKAEKKEEKKSDAPEPLTKPSKSVKKHFRKLGATEFIEGIVIGIIIGLIIARLLF